MNACRGLLEGIAPTDVAASSRGRPRWGNGRFFGGLLKRIPERSNVRMLLNADGPFDSPTGRREKARANHRRGLGLAAAVCR